MTRSPEPQRRLRGLLFADEWLLASLVWLLPLFGIFAVTDATFLRFGLPRAIGLGQWLSFHAVFLLPGSLFLGARVYALWRLHSRSSVVIGSVLRMHKARLGSGWYVTVSYDHEGQTFTRRFYVQSPQLYRRLAASPTAHVLLDPRQPSRSFLAAALADPFAA